jgi:hypothetical protein
VDAQVNPCPQNAPVGLLPAHGQQFIGCYRKFIRLILNLHFVVAEINPILRNAAADAA